MGTGTDTKRLALRPLSGGMHSALAPSLIESSETPFSSNVEFADESVRSIRGSRKLNNQTLLRPALRCMPDPAYSPLFVEAGKSVPLRGYAFIPYAQDTDIGGDFANTGTFGSPNYNTRRGRSFERQITFRLPETFLMQDRPARGENTPASPNAAIEAGCGYDEGLEDCTIILQKGGDRLAPMSWALGIVCAGNHSYTAGLGATNLARRSNYFLVFMWLDSPEWAPGAIFRYSLTNPSVVDAYATEALRAFILDGRDDTVAYALEPGKTYNVSLALQLDSASPSGSSWNNDGRVDLRVQEEGGRFWSGSFVDSGGGGTATNLSAWKGPADSLRYLAKYGIRYSGRDPEFIGLGYRTAPWNAQGFIPCGMDSAAMEHKGFRMADCSANSIDDLYGGGAYTLVCSHAVAGNAYVTINSNRALVLGNTNGAQSYTGRFGSLWGGYGAAASGAPATDFNPDALRGYRAVFPRSSVPDFQGGCFTIQNYVEQSGAEFRLFLQDVGTTAVTWTDQPFLVRAFRWNQQAIDVQELRMWKTSRNYADPRVVWSMAHSLELDDETEPELTKLEAYYPLNDAGGRIARELLRGRHARLAPFGLGLGDDGQEGERTLFLSGEGDALVYDLSEHPVFAREMKELLASNSRGFAIEVSCIIPEAHYGIARLNATSRQPSYEAAFCPDLVTWSVKGADESGGALSALPLLVMGHHSWWGVGTGTSPERRPQGFQLDVSAGLDSEAIAMRTAVLGHTRDAVGAGNWDDGAPWVGKRITLQIGVQPSPDNRNNVANMGSEFRVYIAASPKSVLKYVAGEDPEAEFAYYSDIMVQKKHLPRLMVTIGGGWNPSLARGYTEYGARMIVDKVRVYGATASGELPLTSGAVTSARRGKILGRNSLPQRELAREETLGPLGPGTRTASFVEGSVVVEAPGGTAFFTQLPESSPGSVRERFLVPLSDKFLRPMDDGIAEPVQEFYWIQSVAADGSEVNLGTAYNGARSPRGSAGVTSLVGYTTFSPESSEIERSPLSLGSGQAYRPGLTETKDLVLSEPLFEDLSVVGGKWRVRVAVPFTEGGLATVLPRWVRGLVSPRRSRVTGIAGLDDAVFASNVGSIAKIDDRWREDGPTETLRRSMAFLGVDGEGHEQTFPLAADAARFSNYNNVWPYWSSGLFRGYTWVFDFWIQLERYAEYQSLLWLGCEYSHLLLGPASVDNRRGVGLWLRLANGRPELVREDMGNFTGGSTAPPDGRYVATAADRVQLGEWTHVRYYLDHYFNGSVDVVRIPGVAINGRRSAVVVNGVRDILVAANDWILPHNGGGLIGSIGDTRNALYLGVARDAVRTYSKANFTALAQLGGREYPGNRLVGRMHPLLGRMAGVTVWRALAADPLVAGFPDFDPYTLNYAGRLVRFKADLQEGIGEHLDDGGTDTDVSFPSVTPGIVLSHPALDLYNEFGRSEQAPSFASVNQRVYAANGGRVAFVTEALGGAAGIVPPSTTPKAAIERKPLWEPNSAPVGSSSAEQDPIFGEGGDSGSQTYHYSTHGNAYLKQRTHEEMRWSGPLVDRTMSAFDIFGLKFYWKPRDVTGIRTLWSARTAYDNGGLFLECEDGRARVGWYDTVLKRRVFVETNAPVFRPDYYYYVYLRKSFPTNIQGSSGLTPFPEGRWLNSYNVGGRRRTAIVNETTSFGFAVGQFIRNAGSTKRGLITRVWHITTSGGTKKWTIDYALFSADADFTASEAVVTDVNPTMTATINLPRATTGDSLVIREFAKNGTFSDSVLWGVKAGGTIRSSVSFTSELARPANTTAVGPVTPMGLVYNGLAGGVINAGTSLGVAAPIPVFHADMVGMQWQFAGASSIAPEKVYRIATRSSPTSITVVDENGVNPNLSGFTAVQGAVFAGVELVKSEGMSGLGHSKNPDIAPYDTEFMGTALAADPVLGGVGTDGEFASFGWGVVAAAGPLLEDYRGFLLFEGSTPTELSEIGTDTFPFPIYNLTTELSTSRPGELRFDATRQFTVVDGQPYGGASPSSTQPNAALEVALDTEASVNAESLIWKFTREPSGVSGRRLVFVAFFDKDQDALSNPGPRLVVEVAAEDDGNPGGMAQIILTDLPISHQRGELERHVYMTEADQLVAYRAAIVEDNRSSSVAIRLNDELLRLNPILDVDNPPPPDCSVIGVAQGMMFYGDVAVRGRRRRDAIFFSKPFLPLQVPFENALFLISGSNERVVAMADLNGTLLVWKRDALIEVSVRDGAAFQRILSSNVGAVNPQAVGVLDQDAWWVSNDRGLYLYRASGGPTWMGKKVADLFDEDNDELQVDSYALERCALGANRRQNQIVFAWKERNEREQRRRLSAEFDTGLTELGVQRDPASSARYSHYEGPNVTALGAADRLVPATQRFIAGTEEGFVLQLDRLDSARDLHAPSLVALVTLTAGSSTTKLVLSAPVSGFQDLEGIRGVPLAWLEGGVVRRATALFCDGTNIYLDRALTSAPASGTQVSLGGIPFSWISKRFDLGDPGVRKIPQWMDLIWTPEPSGTAIFEVFTDFNETPRSIAELGIVTSQVTLDLTTGFKKIPLGELRGRYYQFRIRTVPPAVGTRMELLEAVIGFDDAEPYG